VSGLGGERAPAFCPTCGEVAGYCHCPTPGAAGARRSTSGPGDPGPMPTPPDPAAPKPRTVRWTPASSIKPRPVVWAWEDRIPLGELTLTPGRGGLGKSTFHAWLIARTTRGQLPGVYHGTPRRCAIAANEDSWERTIVPRLIAAGADLELVGRVDVSTTVDDLGGTTLSLPEDVPALEQLIRRRGVVLISVDPLISMINGERNTHHDRETRGALEPLGRLADRTGCVVLGNAHFNKTTSSDALDRLIGSVAFGNVARAVLSFAADDDGALIMSQAKNNLGRVDPAIPSLRFTIESVIVDTDEGPSDVGRLVALGESQRSVREILGDRANGDDDERSQRNEIAEWLTGWLRLQPGREARPTDVMGAAKLEGYAWRSVERARRKAKIATVRRGFQGGSVWAFTQDVPSSFAPYTPPSEGGINGANGGANGDVS
jgi:hypothetical protein